MNNKLMYNRCVIPEWGVTTIWKEKEDQDTWKTRKKQRSLLRKKKEEGKGKNKEKGKKREKMKPRERKVWFSRTEDVDGRKRYRKEVRKDYRKKKTNEELTETLIEASLIYKRFLLDHAEEEYYDRIRKKGKKRKRKL